jgi:hypothetical protein
MRQRKPHAKQAPAGCTRTEKDIFRRTHDTSNSSSCFLLFHVFRKLQKFFFTGAIKKHSRGRNHDKLVQGKQILTQEKKDDAENADRFAEYHSYDSRKYILYRSGMLNRRGSAECQRCAAAGNGKHSLPDKKDPNKSDG